MAFVDELKHAYWKQAKATIKPKAKNLFQFRIPFFRLNDTDDAPVIKVDPNGSKFQLYGIGDMRFEINVLKNVHDNRLMKRLLSMLDAYGLTAIISKSNGSEMILIQSRQGHPLDHWLNYILPFVQGFVSTNDIFALDLENISQDI